MYSKGTGEKQMKTQTKQTDDFGNEIEYMTWEQFQSYVTDKSMWCKGDQIQIKNKEGSVIATTILMENGVQHDN